MLKGNNCKKKIVMFGIPFFKSNEGMPALLP